MQWELKLRHPEGGLERARRPKTIPTNSTIEKPKYTNYVLQPRLRTWACTEAQCVLPQGGTGVCVVTTNRNKRHPGSV